MTYNKYGTKSLREEELEGYEDILMDVKSILERAKPFLREPKAGHTKQLIILGSRHTGRQVRE